MTEAVEVLTFPTDHPALPGHFPGDPIVPGVMLLDAVLSAVRRQLDMTVTGVTAAKFLKPLRPGAAVTITLRQKDDTVLEFSCDVGGGRIAAGTLHVRPLARADQCLGG